MSSAFTAHGDIIEEQDRTDGADLNPTRVSSLTPRNHELGEKCIDKLHQAFGAHIVELIQHRLGLLPHFSTAKGHVNLRRKPCVGSAFYSELQELP